MKGSNQLSQQSQEALQALHGQIVNLYVSGDERGMYFHLGNQRYYIDRVRPKAEIPKELTGGMLDFPDPAKHLSIRGGLHFSKNNSYYLLAFVSRKERMAFALTIGKI